MTDKFAEKNLEGKNTSGYMCELCRCSITKEEAAKTDYLHCGRKMTPLEVAYMSSPSPTGA